MAEKTEISWSDATFNPWWGCIEVSPACDNCYARTWAKFTGYDVWGTAAETPRRFFGDKHWNEPRKWNRDAEAAGERRRVFCASMADVFEQNDALDVHRHRLWSLILATPNLDWLLLTKRPQNITRMVPKAWLEWPPFNVWYGTTVENQHYADQRIPILLAVPAAVRFLSMEPLLGPVNLLNDAAITYGPEGGYIGAGNPSYWLTGRPYAGDLTADRHGTGFVRPLQIGPKIDWIITGGESGPGSRPAHPDWYRSLRDQCLTAGVAFHYKQWGNWAPEYVANSKQAAKTALYVIPNGSTQPACTGGRPAGAVTVQNVGKKSAGRLLDGREWNDFPTTQPAPAVGRQ